MPLSQASSTFLTPVRSFPDQHVHPLSLLSQFYFNVQGSNSHGKPGNIMVFVNVQSHRKVIEIAIVNVNFSGYALHGDLDICT